MKKILKGFEANGFIALGKFAHGLLDSTKNALKTAPTEYKYTLSILLASMWCVAFGIYTYELVYIGYNIIGHFVLITCVFITWGVFKFQKKPTPPSPPNRVRWDLNREG